MAACTHPDECPDCARMRNSARDKDELRSEIAKALGVSHLKGERQLEAAVERIRRLLDIEAKSAGVG